MKFIFYCCFVAVMLWVSKTTYTGEGNYRGIASTPGYTSGSLTASDFAKY